MKRAVVMVYDDTEKETRFVASTSFELKRNAKYTIWEEDGEWICKEEYKNDERCCR